MQPVLAVLSALLPVLLAFPVSTASSSAASATRADAAAATMPAVRISRHGSPAVMRVVEAPVPRAKKGEVLVRVHAAGVNPVDWRIRSGQFGGLIPLPHVLGYDFSGTVAGLGDGVTGYAVGDAVFGMLPLNAPGAYAGYVAADARAIARKPERLDHRQAAALPMPALTAAQALFSTAKLQAGQTVLIHGGAGGVGHVAIQLAKAEGARVIATGSGARRDFILGLGADEFVDYTRQPFEQVVSDVDVVLDTVGEDTLERSYGVLKRGGALVSIAGQVDPAKLKSRGLTGGSILVQANGQMLDRLASLADAGRLVPTIERTYPLAEAAAAHERSESRRVQGRLVLDVAGDAQGAK